MIGIVVLSHGSLAEALVTTAVGLVGAREDVTALGLAAGDSPESLGTRLRAIADEQRRDLLLLCDLRGGTPHQVAVDCVRRLGSAHAAALTGVNLGMLCEAVLLCEQSTSVDELSARLVRVGVEQVERFGGADAVAP